MSGYLDTLKDPGEIHDFSRAQLQELADEIREKIVDSISQTGGHFSSNLGTVELSVALHHVFNSPKDKIVWDVGHQAYPHKLLTGRADRFHTIRQTDGLSGFLNIFESEHDAFGAGHAGTACGAALGLAIGNDLLGEDRHTIAVVGDGAMTAGMTFEALNHAGDLKKNLIVILNDNRWSISENVGAMSKYLNNIITGRYYNRAKSNFEKLLESLPSVGAGAVKLLHNAEEHLKGMMVPGIWFEELGFRYFGPVDGHDLNKMIDTLANLKKLKGPILLHAVTTKGKGFGPAEEDAMTWHGPAPFDKVDGTIKKKPGKPTYTQVFVESAIREAKKDKKVCAITAAMATGTGLSKFGEELPDQFFDVGIAEQHAVTMAAGMAKAGLRPIVAIYSTFLQRGYDQIVHDVAIQKLPVVFAIDRAGLVGADGHTHQGMFDISFLRMIPNLALVSPSNEADLVGFLKTALTHDGPIGVRYPRTEIEGEFPDYLDTPPIPLGESRTIREGGDVAILAVGSMVPRAVEAADLLCEAGEDPWVVDMRCIKPLDRNLLKRLAEADVRYLVTVEEHALAGGFGSGVLEAWDEEGLSPVRTLRLGIKDEFVTHGNRNVILERLGLDAQGIAGSVETFLSSARPHVNEPPVKVLTKV